MSEKCGVRNAECGVNSAADPSGLCAARQCAAGLLTCRISELRCRYGWWAAVFLAAAVLLTAPGCKSEQGKPAPSEKAAATATAATRTASPVNSPQHLPTATIRVGPVELAVEVANTEAARQKGMMFRPALAPDEAMLFVYPREHELQFWMKDTLTDLDLAYIAVDGTILQIEHMIARNVEGVRSREPAQFVLEAPAGWFARHSISAGAKVAIPSDVAASARE